MSNHRPYSPDTYRATYSSSPPRSSSPIRTPYSSKHVHSYAYIRSSPEITPESTFRGVMDDFSWGHAYVPSKYPGSAYIHDRDFPPTSDFDASEFSEDVDLELTSDSAPGPSSGISSDSEDEEPQEEDDFGYSFSYEGNRTTFFRTSAERGQWKSNPVPTFLQTRKSVPTHSRVATPTLINPLRTISEPAPASSTPKVITEAPQPLPDHSKLETTSRDIPISIPIDPITAPMEDEVESPHTLPSLSSDRESSLDVDIDAPSSPLPPSSPPLSPVSFSVSIVSRSVSPILFARDSSPLSEAPEDDDAIMNVPGFVEDDVSDLVLIPILLVLKLPKIEIRRIATIQNYNTVNEESHPAATAPLLDERETSDALSFPPSDSQDCDASSVLIAPNSSTPHPSAITVEQAMNIDDKASSSSSNKVKTRVHPVVRKKSATLRDKNGVDRSASEMASTSTTTAPDPKSKSVKEKRKKDTERMVKEKERGGEGPIKGKRKVDEAEDDLMPSRSQKSKKRTEMEVENVDSNSTHAGLKKKRTTKRGDGEGHATTSARTTKRADNGRHPPKAKSIRRSSSTIYSSDDENDVNPSHTTPDSPLDPETVALHSQICGLLIETMAMSRASSLPVSSLFKLVMQDQPSLKTQRSEREWVEIFDRVLHAGEVGRGSGVFGKVESSGKVCFFSFFFLLRLLDSAYFPFLRALVHVLTGHFIYFRRTTRTAPWKLSGSMYPSWMRIKSGPRLSRR